MGVVSWLVVVSAWGKPLDANPLSLSPARLLSVVDGFSPEADSTLILDERRIRFEPDGRMVVTDWRVYHVGSESAAAALSTLDVSWAPEVFARPEIVARVVTPDKREHRLDPDRFIESVEPGDDPVMVEDTRVLRAPLPNLRRGAILEQVVTQRELVPRSTAGRVDRIPLVGFQETGILRRVIEAPVDLSLRWEVAGLDVNALDIDEDKRNGWRTVTFEIEDPATPEFLSALPRGTAPLALVHIGTGTSWEAVSAAYAARIGGVGSAEGLEEAIARVAEGTTERDKIEIATAIARDEVRYTAVEFGHRRIEPYAPVDVFSGGYGDCKDKASLLETLLDAVGIDSDIALLEAGRFSSQVPDGLPGIDLFNHAILYVPGHDLWIDATSRWSEVGALPLQDHGRKALLIRPTGGTLVSTPVQPARYEEHRTSTVTRPGRSHIVEQTSVAGWWAAQLHGDVTAASSRARWEGFRSYADDAFGTDDYTLEVTTEEPGPFQMILETHEGLTTQVTEGSGWFEVIIQPFFDVVPTDFTLRPGILDDPIDARDVPYQVPPVQVSSINEVVLPRGFALETLPEDARWTFGDDAWLSHTTTVSDTGGVTVSIEMDLGDGLFQPDEGATVREALQATAELGQIGLHHPASTAIAEERWVDALEILGDRAGDLQVHESILHATLLSRTGFPAEADALLGALVVAEPDDAIVHLELGQQLYERDPERALTHLRRAHDLEPNREPLHLLQLLVDQGYGDEAISRIEDRRVEGFEGEESLDSLQMRVLLDRGDLDGVMALAQQLDRFTMEVAAAMMLRGESPDLGGEMAPELIELVFDVVAAFPEHRPGLLASTPQLSDFVDALDEADALRFPAKTPQEAVALLVKITLADEPAPGRWDSLVFPSLTTFFRDDVARQRDQGTHPSVATAAVLMSEVEGDAAKGYTLTSFGSDQRLLVLKDRGKFRLLATSADPSPVALRLLDQRGDRKRRDENEGLMNFLQLLMPAAADLDTTDPTHQALIAAMALGSKTPAALAPTLAGITGSARSLAAPACLSMEDFDCVLALTADGGVDNPRLQVSALAMSGRIDEAQAIVSSLSGQVAIDAEAMLLELTEAWPELLAHVGAHTPTELIQSGNYNNLSWGLLHLDRAEEALPYSQASLRGRRSLAALHTLGCIELDLGLTDDAIDTWIAAKASGDELDPVWGYIEGRVAEILGLPEVAEAGFAKVEKSDDPGSTWQLVLAHRRP